MINYVFLMRTVLHLQPQLAPYSQTFIYIVPWDILPDVAATWSVGSHRTLTLEDASPFAPIPTFHHCFPLSYVPKDLLLARYVFIPYDGHRTPLKPPYDGPFHVLFANVKCLYIAH